MTENPVGSNTESTIGKSVATQIVGHMAEILNVGQVNTLIRVVVLFRKGTILQIVSL